MLKMICLKMMIKEEHLGKNNYRKLKSDVEESMDMSNRVKYYIY